MGGLNLSCPFGGVCIAMCTKYCISSVGGVIVVVVFEGEHVNGLEWNECVSENKSIRNASMEGGRCCGQMFV